MSDQSKPLRWTKDKPSRRGWYVRRGHGQRPELMHAHFDREEVNWWVDIMYEEGGEPVDELHKDYEWFGPLPGRLTPKVNKEVSNS